MKKPKLVNRISGLMDQGVERLQSVAGNVQDRVTSDGCWWKRRATDALREGKEKLMPTEAPALRVLKEHPVLLIIAGVFLLGLVVGKLMLDRNDYGDWDDIA
ncbi:MAG: hypothetical protein M3O82_04495 [Verrucomicrobiota bacterium]|nr:hypothetical protein [Verrucomicrobiota bacterium]